MGSTNTHAGSQGQTLILRLCSVNSKEEVKHIPNTPYNLHISLSPINIKFHFLYKVVFIPFLNLLCPSFSPWKLFS